MTTSCCNSYGCYAGHWRHSDESDREFCNGDERPWWWCDQDELEEHEALREMYEEDAADAARQGL